MRGDFCLLEGIWQILKTFLIVTIRGGGGGNGGFWWVEVKDIVKPLTVQQELSDPKRRTVEIGDTHCMSVLAGALN